jgi:hypothetical protein
MGEAAVNRGNGGRCAKMVTKNNFKEADMDIKDLADKVISCKNKTITDEVFLLIQNDRGFMQEYLELVESKGHATVNRQIGRMIAQKYGLTSEDGQNYEPESSLILSHQVYD